MIQARPIKSWSTRLSGYSNKLQTENTEFSAIYDNQGDYEYLFKKKLEEDEQPTTLECVISQDLINLNDRYLETCLMNLQENFVEKTQHELLKNNFFPELQLVKLIQIHKKLQEEIKVVEYDYKQVFKRFKKHEDEFLIYCDVIPKTRHLMEFIKTKVESNREIREEVDKLTEESFLSNRNKDAQDSIQDLLYRIPEAMMRFPLVLGTIAKEARKEELITIEKEAQNAHEMMHKIMLHVDKCSEDNRNIETVRNLENSIKCIAGELRNNGILLGEVRDIVICMRNNPERRLQCWILVFEELLAVIEVKEKKHYQYTKDGKEIELNFFGDPIIRNISEDYYLLQKFKIVKFGEINPIENENKLELITFETGIVEDPNRSFDILFSTKDAREEFERILKNRRAEIKKFENVTPGCEHTNHDFQTFQNDYLESPKIHRKCHQCNDFLGGIVLNAIYCYTCDQYFHLPCFETNEDTEEEEASSHAESGR